MSAVEDLDALRAQITRAAGVVKAAKADGKPTVSCGLCNFSIARSRVRERRLRILNSLHAYGRTIANSSLDTAVSVTLPPSHRRNSACALSGAAASTADWLFDDKLMHEHSELNFNQLCKQSIGL